MIALFLSIFLTINKQEIALFQKINNYRVSNGLPQLVLNDSLNMVAEAHTKDIYEHYGENGDSSLHSWSKSNKWIGGVFNMNDPSTYSIIWDKPKEIAKMKEDGFEISHRHFSSDCGPECAFVSFVNSPPHRNVILEKNGFGKFTKIGISIYQNIVCVWLA